ncbi:MAG: hypothetical protein GKR87_16500 [Kiritimatiellae bacterium]|nr:hypothetical protein [Kiritimatiellia bacterium]
MNTGILPALAQQVMKNRQILSDGFRIMLKSMHGAQTRVAEALCKEADVVLRPVSCDGKWHDFGHPQKYMRIGRQAAEEKIDEIKTLIGTSQEHASEKT